MVEHNCVPPALLGRWKETKFPNTHSCAFLSWKSWLSKKEKPILCIETAYSATNSITQTCYCAFSALKRQERRDKQDYRDIQHLDSFSSCVCLIWRSRPGLETQYISPYKPSQSLMFILGFLKSLYTLSLHWGFSSFEWTIISLEADGVLVKKWWGEKSLRDACSIQQPSVS